MIHRIYINNLGSLINFSNEQNGFVGKKAVIHGMNGTGKTQICSILQQIEKLKKSKILDVTKKKEEEKKILEFVSIRKSKESLTSIIDVKIDNYNASFDTKNYKITENGDIPDIYVFNEDYLNENIGDFLNIHDREIKIGQKNVQRDNLIKERQEKEKALKKVNEEIDKIVEQARVDSGYPDQARTKNTICKENYLKETNPGEPYPEGKNELSKLSDPPDLIMDHHRYSFPILLLEDETKGKIIEIMTKTYIEPKLTQEFYKSYLTIKKNFYEEGVILFNKSRNICPFCLSTKSEDDPIIQEAISYLNSDFNENLNSIQRIIDIFIQKKKELENFIATWNTIIPVIKEKIKILSTNDKIEDIMIDENIFSNCIGLLKVKINKMSNLIEIDKLNIFEEYNSYIGIVNAKYLQQRELIETLNKKIDQISGLKRSIGEKIIKNQMYTLWNNNSLRERNKELIREIENLKTEIDGSSKLISNNRIPDFFNQIIRILGISKYELSGESSLFLKLENDFDISKEGYRISAGERKIIAFSYFLAEVLASAVSNAELLQKTIIIDDPVDSSDYDKFYSFISVVEKFNEILINIFKNSEIEFGQILIFTHSALLYERLLNSKKINYYLLSLDNNKTIIEIPEKKISLTTFSSYMKKITNYIKRMECSNTRDIGNYIRRVLEIICSIENIDSNEITNINASSKLNALANHLSHESIERILDPLPISCEYIEACIELVQEIKERIPYLYKSIVGKYFKGNEIEHYKIEYEKKYLNI
jgi:hypothetical protein